MAEPPRLFDRPLVRQRLNRAAPRFEAFLKERAASDLVERLSAVNRRFPLAIELGARTGVFGRALAANGAMDKVDRLIEADLSPAMLARVGGAKVVADEARQPFAEASADLVVSCLSLHTVDDLVGALVQIRRTLRPDGLFIGALFGGATLTELRQCLTAAEAEIRGGAGPRVLPFLDSYDGAALLQRAGFALPVVDLDTVVVRYDHLLKLLADLRAMGESNVLADRPKSGLSRPILARAGDLYAERFAETDGRLRATFEIITLTGWAPHPDQPQPLKPGSAKVRLADALGVKERSAGEEAG